MTVLIAKMLSHIGNPALLEERRSPLSFSWVSSFHISHYTYKLNIYISSLLLFFIVATGFFYVIQINFILFEGKNINTLEATLIDLQHQKKIRQATLEALRSPLAIKTEAITKQHMIEITDVHYVSEGTPDTVAANTSSRFEP